MKSQVSSVKSNLEWYSYLIKNLIRRECIARLHLSRRDLKEVVGKSLLSTEETNQLIASKIQEGVPFMVGRFGGTELSTIVSVLRAHKFPHIDRREYYLERLYRLSGFFPQSIELEEKFTNLMLQYAEDVDLLGTWQLFMEDYIIKKYAIQTQVTKLGFLSPWELRNMPDSKVKPWSHALAGKKVLVIHPFEDSIKEQYENHREHIFENIFPAEDILPVFDLKTIKAVQSLGGENTEQFETWFNALDYMIDQCRKQDFDVAIIGCGAYGFPLAAEIKKMGKCAIHLGGATQLMFGIKGRRWMENSFAEFADNVINNYWVSPSNEETPKSAARVEGGCYW